MYRKERSPYLNKIHTIEKWVWRSQAEMEKDQSVIDDEWRLKPFYKRFLRMKDTVTTNKWNAEWLLFQDGLWKPEPGWRVVSLNVSECKVDLLLEKDDY